MADIRYCYERIGGLPVNRLVIGEGLMPADIEIFACVQELSRYIKSLGVLSGAILIYGFCIGTVGSSTGCSLLLIPKVMTLCRKNVSV